MDTIKAIKKTSNYMEDAVRILCMQFVLAPSAYLLPRKWSIGIANALSWLLVFLPRPGMEKYWRIRQTFGKKRLESIILTWRCLSRPYRDFVVLKRVLYKRESPNNWKIVEKNADNIKNLRESGVSYIVATGHFTREAMLGLFSPSVTFGNSIIVSNAVPKRIRSLHDILVRIQLGTLIKSAYFAWGEKIEFKYVGSDTSPFREILSRLKDKGCTVVIHVDAPWKKSTGGFYERPFAGFENRVFAKGAAGLARLSKCPIITCVCTIESDNTILIEWGPQIHYSDQGGGDDITVMNKLNDKLEVAIGERPDQYVIWIGGDRRWNSEYKLWEKMIV